jgi:hypothetical protein
MDNKCMMLFSSIWTTENSKLKTFKMLPTSKDCPFNEVLLDPENKVVAVVSKETKNTYRLIPKVDDKGRPVMVKDGSGNPTLAQERKLMESFYEYYIDDINDIELFITTFAINSDSFNWKSYLI